MSTNEDNCFVCNEPILEGQGIRTITATGLESFRRASVSRQDGKHHILSQCDSIRTHDSCAKNYTSKEHIKCSTRKERTKSVSEVRPTRSSSGGEFDYKNLCLVCEEDASDDLIIKQKKNPDRKRKVIRKIASAERRQQLIEGLKNNSDDLSLVVLSRIYSVDDLVAAEARYHDSCRKKLDFLCSHPSCSGEKVPTSVEIAAKYIYKYIAANSEKSQYNINSILEDFNETERPDNRYIKNKLEEIYGDDITVTPTKDGLIITFKKSIKDIVANHWYSKKYENEYEKRKSIVMEAAKIINEDIKLKLYETSCYPSTSTFFDKAEDDVPETLKLLLDHLISQNKSKPEDYRIKIIAIAHAIIANCRPRSFLSPLQIGLASVLSKQYASKELIEMLNALGFCSSYSETQTFESSVIHHHQYLNFDERAYSQFVFDNADHNINTIDGRNTFHAMGGIQVVTPYDSVTSDKTIERQKISATDAGEFGKVPIKFFKKTANSGYNNVIIKDLSTLIDISIDAKLSAVDFLWLMGKQKLQSDFPGWNGYMEKVMRNNRFDKSRVLLLKFIDKPATDYSTILTSLIMADNERKKLKQKHCFVSFDQSLYHKAREIIECSPELSSVFVRLGGFHMLMSFMGAIGYIMDGSGLRELFNEIYAENSVDKILNGHAYARAVRGHILNHLALSQLILSSFQLSEQEEKLIHDLFDLDNNDITVDVNKIEFKEIYDRFMIHIGKLKSKGPTSQLWLQYFDMVTIIKQFIEAERSGNWKLHLQSVRRMLPYFYASGHHLYAKSGTIYLQDMLQLEDNMDREEYKRFTEDGYFTIRRTDKFWCGIWSDMAIEQILMRTMKTRGGLTRGRGITDSVLSKWILTMPALTDLTNSMLKFCNLNISSSEQHVDTGVARLSRDTEDLKKLLDFFRKYDPFFISDDILSITSGLQGDKSVNCHKALERGELLLKNTIDKSVNEIKYQRSTRVIPLQKMNSVKVHDKEIIINPTLIFQRISVAVEGKEKLSEYLAYELAPYPVSIFDNGTMRKNEKSSLYNCFTAIDDLSCINGCRYVIDGGLLLHKIVWPLKETFDGILNRYVEYVKKNFSPDSIIVFDGYPENAKSTKSAERKRRKTTQFCTEINVNLQIQPNVKQEKFFSNEKNKQKFIQSLRERFNNYNIDTYQAYEDADTLIVETAMKICDNSKPTVIVAEDIDVLVIFTQRVPADSNIYFLKPTKHQGRGELYDNNSFNTPELKHLICFIHAFCGCDTTSAFYKHGKNKIIKVLLDNPDVKREAENFNSNIAENSIIDEAGEKITSALYFGRRRKRMNLNELRYIGFKACSVKKAFNLSSLPPTSAAAAQHSRRVFCQVQKWLGNDVEETTWGWREENGELKPIYSNVEMIPVDLMKDISCRCKNICGRSCTCVRYGLRCSAFCGNCHGESCENNTINIISDEIEIDDTENDENLGEIEPADIADIDEEYCSDGDVKTNTDDDDVSFEIPRKRQKNQ